MHLIFNNLVCILYIFQEIYIKFFSYIEICMRVDLMEEGLCLVNSYTTNAILRETKYFQTLT